MKHFTHKYNNTFFDFFIFGDRILTNLFMLSDKLYLDAGSPLINYEFYTDIQTYINLLSRIKAPTAQSLYLVAQYQIDSISELIDVINEKWAENNKEFANERSNFITDVPLKQFLPLIASHSSNKELVDCFYILNNEEINHGLIFNPLLSMEQVITLIKQNQDLGRFLIQDTNYKLSRELLYFFVEQDKLNHKTDGKYRFCNNIIDYRTNLTEQEIATILPAFYDDFIFKVVVGQNLPQYINESLVFNDKNLQAQSLLNVKYPHRSHIMDRLTQLRTGGRQLYELFDTVDLSGNNFASYRRF
jgi:hypothetical protein